MALTFNRIYAEVRQKGIREHVYDITLDAAYPAGGWVVGPSDFTMDGVRFVDAQALAPGAPEVVFAYDHQNGKLIAHDMTTGLPITGGEAGGVILRCYVRGY